MCPSQSQHPIDGRKTFENRETHHSCKESSTTMSAFSPQSSLQATSQTRSGVLVETILVTALILLGLAVRRGPLEIDTSLVVQIHGWDTGALRALFGALNWLGNVVVWNLGLVLAAGAFWLARRRLSAAFLVSGMSVEMLTVFVKTLVHRPPPLGMTAADLIQTGSFPSGHVVRAVVTLGLCLMLLSWHRPRWRLPMIFATCAYLLLLGSARVTSGEHWPSDVFGGYLLGGLWLGFLFMAWKWWAASQRHQLEGRARDEDARTPPWSRHGRTHPDH